MNLNRKVLSDALTTVLVQFALQVRGLLLIPLIAYPFGGEIYGVFVQVITTTTILSNVFGLGLHASLVNQFQRHDDVAARSRRYWMIFLVMALSGTLGSLLVYSLAGVLSGLTLNTAAFTSAFRTGAILVVVLSLLNLSQNYFRANMRVKTFSVINGLQEYLTVGFVAVSIFVFDGGFHLVLVSFVAAKLLALLSLQALIVRRIGLSVPTRDIGGALHYGWTFMSTVLLSQLLNDIDKIILGGFLGPGAVGLYSTGYRVASAIRVFVNGITSTFFAEFNRLWKEGDFQTVEDLLSTGVRYFLILAIPSVAGIYLVGSDVVALIFDGSVDVRTPLVLLVIALGVLMYAIGTIYSQVFYASEQTRDLVKVTAVCVVINILLNLALVPRIGLLGAASATLLCYSLMLWGILWLIPDSVEVALSWRSITRMVASATVFTALFPLIEIHFVYVVLLAPFAYFGLLFLVGELQAEEVRTLVGTLQGE